MAYGMQRERTVAVGTTVTPTVSMHIYHTHRASPAPAFPP
jgi:hypothetical protein